VLTLALRADAATFAGGFAIARTYFATVVRAIPIPSLSRIIVTVILARS
jgi:hypothetical protein